MYVYNALCRSYRTLKTLQSPMEALEDTVKLYGARTDKLSSSITLPQKVQNFTDRPNA